MPEQYKNLDIESWLFQQCCSSIEKERVKDELKLYKKLDMLDSLKYLKYISDIAAKNKIVFGVGRGSSVASYCLFLLKIHRVDSILYNLDIKEFLR